MNSGFMLSIVVPVNPEKSVGLNCWKKSSGLTLVKSVGGAGRGGTVVPPGGIVVPPGGGVVVPPGGGVVVPPGGGVVVPPGGGVVVPSGGGVVVPPGGGVVVSPVGGLVASPGGGVVVPSGGGGNCAEATGRYSPHMTATIALEISRFFIVIPISS
ncbi:MAG: hypothetical protein Q7V56_02090 [Gammaproteobacteria bacterium]|nr:hypothetical protein [Gammaproteobacteria bacterium]